MVAALSGALTGHVRRCEMLPAHQKINQVSDDAKPARSQPAAETDWECRAVPVSLLMGHVLP